AGNEMANRSGPAVCAPVASVTSAARASDRANARARERMRMTPVFHHSVNGAGARDWGLGAGCRATSRGTTRDEAAPGRVVPLAAVCDRTGAGRVRDPGDGRHGERALQQLGAR